MTQKILLLLTFDYELSLGRNFLPPDQVLFGPTTRVLEICDRHSVRATFFPDVCSVWAHRAVGLDDYADKFEAQMKGALSAGHDIQLHLHPHWLSSIFVNGEWLISTDKMYLHELGFEGEDSAGALIGRGIRYLNDLLCPVSPGYACNGFRAAGLALQPHEKEIIAALWENGIRVDTSIPKGLRMKIDTIFNDYRRVPARANWRMGPQSGIEIEAEEGVLEFPVISFKSGLIAQLGFLRRRAMSVGQIRGTTISRAKRQSRMANMRTMAFQNLRYVTGRPWFLLSFDTKGFNLRMLIEGLEQYAARHRGDNVIIGCVVSHPKLMFDTQMKLMSDFITESRRRFEITFPTCKEAFAVYRDIFPQMGMPPSRR